MDILEVGDDSARTRRTPTLARLLVAAVVIALAVGMAVAAWRWWVEQASRPDRLEIPAIAATGPFGISGADLPPDWPEGIVAGALLLRAEVAGDPQRAVRVSPAGVTGAYAAISAQSPAGDAVSVPPGQVTTVDVVVTPADCGALMTAALPVGSPLIEESGADVPFTDPARATLADALRTLCAPAGDSPRLTASDARIDVFFRDRTLVVNSVLDSVAERALLQPLDGTALRGLRTREADPVAGVAEVQLRWLVSPGEMAPSTSLVGRVRAFTIIDGRAYPWLLAMPIPRDLTVSTDAPSPLRNDGMSPSP